MDIGDKSLRIRKGIVGVLLALSLISSPAKINASINANNKESIEKTTGDLESMIDRFGSNIEQEYNFSQSDCNKYIRWMQDAIDQSKVEHNYMIIVDKEGYALYLIRDGGVVSRFDVAYGQNPFFDKEKEGDLRTPEGRYYVNEKLGENRTNYHRALRINYPNLDDKREFKELKRKGIVGPKEKIGSNILIHGLYDGNSTGNLGKNWTEGCVALRNNDIDRLFFSVPIGTPVVIVRYGSGLLFSDGKNDYSANR